MKPEHPTEKNFNIFASLLLQGIGVGLILIPYHLGITYGPIYTLTFAVLGILCFITALSLQVLTVWAFSWKKRLVIRISSILLFIVSGITLLQSEHLIGGFAMFIVGGVKIFTLFPLSERLRKINFTNLTISAISFTTGIILLFSQMNASEEIDTTYMPLLVAGFFITAFIGGATVILPHLKYSDLFNLLQFFPWASLVVFYILPTGMEDLIIPALVITALVFGKLIPWNRLTIPEGDILSRRVVMIAYFTEIAHLIFLGALLYTIDLGLGNNFNTVLTAREATLAFFLLFSVMIYYATTTVIMTTNGLIQELNRTGDEVTYSSDESQPWSGRLARYIQPFIMTPEGVRGRIQADQISTLARQTAIEKKRSAQLTLVLELSQQLDTHLDRHVSAQLAANTLERALNCALAIIFLHEPDNKDFVILASAGKQTNLIPLVYRQDSTKGILGRALRQRKTQVVSDIRYDPDYLPFNDEKNLSVAVIPLIFNGHIHGMISLSHDKTDAFGGLEIGLAETVAAELIRAWERTGYQQRLTELIQTGSQLSSSLDPETTAQEVASISRSIIQAKFTYIYIQLGQDRTYIQQAHSGNAPLLLESLQDPRTSKELINLATHTSLPFRIRDIRRYEKTAELKIDNSGLRSLLTIPLRLHHVSIGAIFAFGKQNEVFFTENDQSLAELISIQASGTFESTWLQQELRSSLRITSLLYRLSNQIIQSENIEDAIYDIAQTTHRLGNSLITGIVLLSAENEVMAEVQIDEKGKHVGVEHPMSLVQDAMSSGQTIYFSRGESIIRTCLPIQTPIQAYGAIWMDTLEDPSKPATASNDLQALVNQAAIALERSLLLVESRRQAKEIKVAYDKLESTYDQTLASLTIALDARDRETEGHSIRVTHLAVKLGETLGYSAEKLKILERGALLHDIGKIGISDTILHKPGPLTADEWEIMRLHPDIGAKIVEGIPFLEDTIPLIRHHQERWDGTGYPGKLRGDEIPELARLFSVIDAFDALTSNRPYRQRISKEEALEYLKEQAGILFDPAMVNALETLCQQDPEVLVATSD